MSLPALFARLRQTVGLRDFLRLLGFELTGTGNTQQLRASNVEKCSPSSPSRLRLRCGHAVYYLHNLTTSGEPVVSNLFNFLN